MRRRRDRLAVRHERGCDRRACNHGARPAPEAYIPGDRRRALSQGLSLPSHVRGAALFADISGFTPLTEALANELGSQRASEVLTGPRAELASSYAVIAQLDRYGGDVLHLLQRRRDHVLARRR